MQTKLQSILVAGVVAAAMCGATLGHAQGTPTSPAAKNAATAPAAKGFDARTPAVTGYRFVTVIKSQSNLVSASDHQRGTSNAQAGTQVIYSMAYPDMKACLEGKAVLSELMGADVKVVGNSYRAVATAVETYKHSECMPSSGP